MEIKFRPRDNQSGGRQAGLTEVKKIIKHEKSFMKAMTFENFMLKMAIWLGLEETNN